jgi:hypothetical protein
MSHIDSTGKVVKIPTALNANPWQRSGELAFAAVKKHGNPWLRPPNLLAATAKHFPILKGLHHPAQRWPMPIGKGIGSHFLHSNRSVSGFAIFAADHARRRARVCHRSQAKVRCKG